MNGPLRKASVAVVLMFLALLVNANVVQVGEAGSLRNNPHNSARLIEQYQNERGPILVGTTPVAKSVPSPKDTLKYLRVYPGGPEYAPVTGFYSLVYGTTGIESAENSVLSGSTSGLAISRLSDLISGRKRPGGAVQLTIDARAQDAAWHALAGRTGAVVALDPRTGAILALVSSPSYDPSVLTTHHPAQIAAAYAKLSKDPGNPLLDRALRETYPPGSTFKVVVTAAALASGKYTPSSILPAPPAYKLPDTVTYLHNFAGETCGSNNTISLANALRISCNTAYAGLGAALGADRLRQAAEGFGFDQSLSVPLTVVASHYPSSPNAPQTALSAIGQYNDRMTAMQGAMIAAGVANGGVVMKPYLVAQTLAPDLSVLSRAQPQTLRRAMSAADAQTLTAMMELVVQSGTGTAAALPGIPVAAKTGTAQHGGNAPEDAWFVCFAPANAPRVAVAVVLPNAGATGGQVAAPVARAVMAAVLGH